MALRVLIFRLVMGFAAGLCVLQVQSAEAGGPARGEGSARKRPQYESGLLAVTVRDVQRIVAGVPDKGDAKLARQLGGLVLTERMSDATLALLEKSMPGARSRTALIALADASAFLRPAAEDVDSEAAPDLNEQRRIMSRAVEYLGKSLPKLPDFYATRITVRYDGDPPKAKSKAQGKTHEAWREVGRSKVVVVYRDGKEVVDPRAWVRRAADPEGGGLITRGTFGPILSTVIVDAAHGETTWDRWERGNAGTMAVFRYRVPGNRSHYSVSFANDVAQEGSTTGYHGEVAIDPTTGAILRLTVQADPPLGSTILEGDILVEYGPVEIGGKMYTCPLRSVSVSLTMAGLASGTGSYGPVLVRSKEATLLNDVVFEDYHLFRSDSRILTGDIGVADR